MWYDTDEDERLILTELNGYGIMKEYNYDYNC